jgi:threonine dehydrogenase-like Zn-dependent dehydrogenase
MSYAQGALLEPLSVVLHGLSRVKLAIGHGAMICGAGPIGLIALAAARASGAHPIVITDLEPKRLAFAKEFVPSCEVYQVDTALDAESNATEIRALFGPTEYEAPATILECTGSRVKCCNGGTCSANRRRSDGDWCGKRYHEQPSLHENQSIRGKMQPACNETNIQTGQLTIRYSDQSEIHQ